MGESIINDLQKQERDILIKREYHKKEIRVLTKNLYNIRQKIKYVKKNENKKPSGVLFEMFGKKRSELTAEELKEYNRAMQNRKRGQNKKI
jgi:hypothetical protein